MEDLKEQFLQEIKLSVNVCLDKECFTYNDIDDVNALSDSLYSIVKKQIDDLTKESRDFENRLYECSKDNAKLIGKNNELEYKNEEMREALDDLYHHRVGSDDKTRKLLNLK